MDPLINSNISSGIFQVCNLCGWLLRTPEPVSGSPSSSAMFKNLEERIGSGSGDQRYIAFIIFE